MPQPVAAARPQPQHRDALRYWLVGLGLTSATLLFVSLFIAPPLVAHDRLVFRISLHALLGGGGSLFLVLALVPLIQRRALRKRATSRGDRRRAGIHGSAGIIGLLLLVVHVAGASGFGPGTLAAFALALVVLSGAAGMFFWRRPVAAGQGRRLRRVWLPMHLLAFTALVIGLLIHVGQLLYF